MDTTRLSGEDIGCWSVFLRERGDKTSNSKAAEIIMYGKMLKGRFFHYE